MSQPRHAALKSSYKLNPPAMGVFAIRNLATGRTLLGRSTNLPGIINRHRFELKLGKHHNADLQADWKRDGEAGFSFEVVDTVAPSADPAFDAVAELETLLAMHLEQCPRGSAQSYL
jgi:hypothetical protein